MPQPLTMEATLAWPPCLQPVSRPEWDAISAVMPADGEADVCLPGGGHHRGDAAPVIPDGAPPQFRCVIEAENGLAAPSVERLSHLIE